MRSPVRRAGRHLARRHRLALADDPDDLAVARRAEVEHLLVRQQPIEQRAERIHVGRHRHRFAADLLGAGALGRERADRRVAAHPALFEQLRDPEVEQLGDAVSGDEDVGGLDVAVDDQALMRVMDGVAHLPEHRQPLADRQLPLPAVLVDGRAVHVLHHHERQAVGRGSGVEHAGDVGVIERGENPPLFEESPDQLGRRDVPGDDLDRHVLVERLVRPLGQIDGSHAAPADLLQEPIVADLGSGTERRRAVAVLRLAVGTEGRTARR